MLDILLRAWLQRTAQEHICGQLYGVLREEFARRGQVPGAAAVGEAAGDRPLRCDVAIVAAQERELVGLLDQLSGAVAIRTPAMKLWRGCFERRGLLLATPHDAGIKRVPHTVAAVLTGHRPAWCVFVGFCQALQPELRTGDVVLADGLVSADRDAQSPAGDTGHTPLAPALLGSTSKRIPAGARVHVGAVVDGNARAWKPAARKQLGDRHGALAALPGVAAAAEASARAATPFLAAGVVLQELRDAPPRELDRVRKQRSAAGMLGAIIGGLLNQPGSTRRLYRQHQRELLAADSLAAALKAVIGMLQTS